MPRRIQIAVIGGGQCSEQAGQLAEQVGMEIARRGAVLICGGMGGVMDAAAHGAAQCGGLTIGVLPVYDDKHASSWLDVVIPTGFGHGRNVIVAASGDAVIALAGEHGTASEIALALTLRRVVIGLQAWESYPGVRLANSPKEAVEAALAAAAARAHS